jgi:hypothetical protein
MQTPQRELLTDFGARLAHTLQMNRCPHCEGPFNSKLVHLSLHVMELSNCDDPAPVLRRELPWCPKCETEPFNTGCVHVEAAIMATLKPGIKVLGEDVPRCDFCLRAVDSVDQLKTYEIDLRDQTEVIAKLSDQLELLDSSGWGACEKCAALIDAKKLSDLVERCVTGFVELYPELSQVSIEAVRNKITVTCLLLFGGWFR